MRKQPTPPQTPRKPFLKRRWVRRALIAAGVLFILYNLIGFLVLPPLIRYYASKIGTKLLQRQVLVGQARVNPYALSLTVRDVVIKEPDGGADFFSLDEAYVNLQAISAIKLAPVLSRIQIVRPTLNIIRVNPARFNFSDLLERPASPPSENPFRFSLNHITVENAAVHFDDRVIGEKHDLQDINLAVPSISNFKTYLDRDVQPYFSARLDGSLLLFEGETLPFRDSRDTRLRLSAEGVDLSQYAAYIPNKGGLSLSGGKLSFNIVLAYVQSANSAPSLAVSGDAELSDLRINDAQDGELFAMQSLNLIGLKALPFSREISLRQLRVAAPRLSLRRNDVGMLNLGEFAAKPAAKMKIPATAQTEKQSFAFQIDSLALADGCFSWRDESLPTTANLNIEDIQLQADNLSNARNTQADATLSLRIGQGAFNSTARFSLNPIAATSSFEMKDLDLRQFQPYWEDQLRLALQNGNFRASGVVAIARAENGELGGEFKGEMAVEGISAAARPNGDELLRWQSFALKGIDASFAPPRLAIEEIALDQPWADIIISEDRAFNLANLMIARSPVPAAAETAAPAAKIAPDALHVGRIAITGGSCAVTDHSTTPRYEMNLDEFNAAIENISPGREETATLAATARMDSESLLRIAGEILLAPGAPRADIQCSLGAWDLSPLSPYAGKYLGYAVEKGKLTLNLAYAVDNRQLRAENRIFLDQFTLGNRVESPDATNLPVKLAIALLKDRNGIINLDVPVSGSLDDPEFRILPIVLKVVVNIIEKAITSPFAFLGAGEESSFVEFTFGASELDAQARDKLDKLAKALADRPALRFDVRAQSMAVSDKEALREQWFKRKLKIQKLLQQTGGEARAVSLAGVEIAPAEYAFLLRKAYEAEDILDRPRDIIGGLKSLPDPEMETMLRQTIKVTSDDLRALAYKRAVAVRAYLIEKGAIEAKRVFLVEPDLLDPENLELKPRAEFALKVAGETSPEDQPFVEPTLGPEHRDIVALPAQPSNTKWRILGGIGVAGLALLVFAL